MKKLRIFILFTFVFILSGCSIEYNLTINEDNTVNERIIASEKTKRLESLTRLKGDQAVTYLYDMFKRNDENIEINSREDEYNTYATASVSHDNINTYASKFSSDVFEKVKIEKDNDIVMFTAVQTNLLGGNSNYSLIYDDITIVGVVKNMETSTNQTVIYMYEGKVVSSINLDYYELTVIDDKECSNVPELLYTDGTTGIYSYCVNDVMITYDNDNVYDLATALSSYKISIDKIIDDMKLDKKENNQELYKSKNYNIIKCNDNYIIGNSKLSLKNNVCSLIEETN